MLLQKDVVAIFVGLNWQKYKIIKTDEPKTDYTISLLIVHK